MARTSSGTTIQASASNAAAATTNSTAVNNTTGYGAFITAQVTNGGTGPTVACTVTLQTSIDNAAWNPAGSGTAGVTASGVYNFDFEVPMHVLYARVSFGGNTAQAVTVAAQAHQTTAI